MAFWGKKSVLISLCFVLILSTAFGVDKPHKGKHHLRSRFPVKKGMTKSECISKLGFWLKINKCSLERKFDNEGDCKKDFGGFWKGGKCLLVDKEDKCNADSDKECKFNGQLVLKNGKTAVCFIAGTCGSDGGTCSAPINDKDNREVFGQEFFDWAAYAAKKCS